MSISCVFACFDVGLNEYNKVVEIYVEGDRGGGVTEFIDFMHVNSL